jgi:hypothetical protein
MNITLLVDHRQSVGPIRDQGARPTCLSFAATSAHEHARRSTMALSPEYLHYFMSVSDPRAGASFPELARALRNPGQPSEADCPYCHNGLPPGWLPPPGVKLYRRESDLMDPVADEVETMLTAGSAPILGISLPDGFFSPAPPWLISHDGPIRGFHAVVAVGLGKVDTLRYFLVRNSWGIEWGDNGHVWLDDVFLNRHLRNALALTEEMP